MTQALYAHMNKIKFFLKRGIGMQGSSMVLGTKTVQGLKLMVETMTHVFLTNSGSTRSL
jgi:hypothetical protein